MKPRGIFKLAVIGLALANSAFAQSDVAKLYKDAQQAQASGDLATATRMYEAIVRAEPHMAEAYANLGNLYYQQGQVERAKAAYRKAISQKPQLAGPNFLLGVILFGERDYANALGLFEKAATEQPTNPLIYAYLGYAKFARSEFAQATSNLEKANALDGTDVDVLYHLSKSYGHLAKQAFAQLQTRFPGSVYLFLARAHLAETNEDWEDAAKQYGLALEKMPDDAHLRERAEFSSAKAAGKAKSSDASVVDELVEGSIIYKDSPPTGAKLREEITRWQSKASGLGSIDKSDQQQYLQGEGYQALAYLTSLAVFELNPDSYRAHQLRAQMFEESKNDDGAIREYREALKRKPDLQNIHCAIGSLYWKNRHEDDAWTELQLELKNNAHHPQALYELGDLCAAKEKLSEAEKYLLEAVRLDPGLTEARYDLEKIYTEGGHYDRSIAQLRALLKTNPSEARAHYRLAEIYRKLAQPREAERELNLFNQNRVQPTPPQLGSSTLK